MSEATSWREFEEQGCTCLIGENGQLAVRVVPERGGKIISLVDMQTSREWIHRTNRPWAKLEYGMNWGEGDQGGWDEMFPTIEACSCPDAPWTDKRYPDHGEVWCMPWRHRIEGQKLQLTVEGVQVPYVLNKEITLNGNELRMEYRLDNPTPNPMSYLWAAHPLLKISPGMKLVTEPSLEKIQIAYSHLDRLGKRMDMANFPKAATTQGGEVDLSVLEDGTSLAAEKYYFTEPLREGIAGLVDPATGRSLVFRFSSVENPYLAIWAHYGGFGDYTFAIEPASGYMDNVNDAYRMGKVMQVLGHSTNRWTLRATLEGRGREDE